MAASKFAIAPEYLSKFNNDTPDGKAITENQTTIHSPAALSSIHRGHIAIPAEGCEVRIYLVHDADGNVIACGSEDECAGISEPC